MTIRVAVLFALGIVLLSPCYGAQTTDFSSVLPAGSDVSFMSLDASGNIYVAGDAYVADSPGGAINFFVAEVSADGSSLIYLTVVGQQEYPIFFGFTGLAVGPDGSAHVIVVETTRLGDSWSITNLDPSGNIIESPAAPMSGFSPIDNVATDSAGNLYFTQSTFLNAQCFLYKTNSTRTQTIWQFPGYCGLIAVDSKGNVYVQGAAYADHTISTSSNAIEPSFTDGCAPALCRHQWVAAINETGSSLIYATYLTSTLGETPSGITVDQSGNAYVVGSTASTDYPVTANAFEDTFSALAPNSSYAGYSAITKSLGPGTPATGYVSALDPGGNLIFSTYFGGSATDLINGVAVDSANNVLYLEGTAASSDLPGLSGGNHHCVPASFITQMPTNGSGVGRSVPVFALGGFAVTGKDQVVFSSGSQLDQLNFDAPDTLISCLANSDDLSITESVVPGQLLTIFGNQFASSAQSASTTAKSFPTSVEGVSATINGIPVPLLYVSADQINVQVPFEVTGQSQVNLQLQTVDQAGSPVSDSRKNLTVTATNPIVFEVPVPAGECPGSYPGQTKTYARNQDGSVNGCSNPAQPNSIVTIFVDGLGNLVPIGVSGGVTPNAAPLTVPVSLTTNTSSTLSVVSANSLAGSISGLYGIQVQVPAVFTPASLNVGPTTAQGVVAIAVAP
jgi:uncharacterized protein (TIGR03437 family)